MVETPDPNADPQPLTPRSNAKRLIDQLSSEYGEQFSVEDATVAVDSLNVDWNAQAAESARNGGINRWPQRPARRPLMVSGSRGSCGDGH